MIMGVVKSLRKITEETYDNAAEGYSKRYAEIGARTNDVSKVFSYVEKENPVVMEIGCGNGRDAASILEHTNNYTGIDISAGMLAIAQKALPKANFVKADVATYDFPKCIDIIFAFASLLHISKEELHTILAKIHESLNEKGVVFISLKKGSHYEERVVEGQYGKRQFFYYSKNDVLEAAGGLFTEFWYDEQDREEQWFTLILQKK